MVSSRAGMITMILAMLVFAAQDGISKHLAAEYNVFFVVMIRYWFFALFVITITRLPGRIRAPAKQTKRPYLQILRGLLLAVEICVMVTAFTLLGLVESHAIFAAYPLLVAALSVPLLGEKVGWRRWMAILLGFVGVMIVIKPGFGVFSPAALIAVASATLFAFYSVLTRYVGQSDTTEISFFWTGTIGAIFMTVVGLKYWTSMSQIDWVWMAVLCVFGALGHFLLIKAYELSEAHTIQPFAFFQLVFASLVGVLFFGETVELNVLVGAFIVVAAGIFTLMRASQKESL